MIFEKRDYSFWKYFGYVLMFFISSTIFYLLLTMSGKLPKSWNYLNITLIILLLILVGKGIKCWLKKS